MNTGPMRPRIHQQVRLASQIRGRIPRGKIGNWCTVISAVSPSEAIVVHERGLRDVKAGRKDVVYCLDTVSLTHGRLYAEARGPKDMINNYRSLVGQNQPRLMLNEPTFTFVLAWLIKVRSTFLAT